MKDDKFCPCCGGSMIKGTLCGTGRGFMQWREGPYQGGLDALRFTGRKLDLEGREPAWYCKGCGSILLQTDRPLEKAGPNYVWKNGKPCPVGEEES